MTDWQVFWLMYLTLFIVYGIITGVKDGKG
jgi:hypothetical protein